MIASLLAYSISRLILLGMAEFHFLSLAVYISARIPIRFYGVHVSSKIHYAKYIAYRDVFSTHTTEESLIFSIWWNSRTGENAWYEMVEFLKCKSATLPFAIRGR